MAGILRVAKLIEHAAEIRCTHDAHAVLRTVDFDIVSGEVGFTGLFVKLIDAQ
ncbi:hypothetical protein D3C75_1317160 [compost metagenome]